MSGSQRAVFATIAAIVCALVLGCVAPGTTGGEASGGAAAPISTSPATPVQAARLRRVMVPLLKVMDNPIPIEQVSVGIMNEAEINAANAGAGRFYVTEGLLARASDDHLRAVLAHEIAHEDLHHVAKAQVLAAGVGVGAALIDQIFPGTGQFTPIAGQLLILKYSRTEELAADAHGADLLVRAGLRRDLMVEGLIWLVQTSGGSGGGILATHPATSERIAALRAKR